MISFHLAYRVMRFNEYVSYCDLHVGRILLELSGGELLPCISRDEIE